MQDNYLNINFDLNKFLKDIKLKKQYVKNLNDKNFFLSNIKEKNYKLIYKKNSFNKHDYLVMYIIDISFSRSNTLLHVLDFAGNLKFFCSAGSFNYSGKSKRSRLTVLKEFYRILLSNLKFLKGKPVALHLKNVGSYKFRIIKKLKKKFFIKIIRNFNFYPHNGCRKQKIRRKKIKKKEEVAEWFKAADCKSVEFFSS